MTTQSFWMGANTDRLTHPPLDRPITVNVAIIGAGITGATAAYLLKQQGRSVAVLERSRRGAVNTGHTTAHLTHVTDLRLSEAVSKFGADHAEAVWDAGAAAIDQIEKIVGEIPADCDFERVPGYLCAALDAQTDQRAELKSDAQLASEMGFSATYLDVVPLLNRPGIRFANQAQFHPLNYVNALLSQIPGNGSHVCELTDVSEFSPDDSFLLANGQRVHFDQVVIATDIPLAGQANLLRATLLQTKIAPYTTYAVSAKVPTGIVPDALFWDLADPYHYLRKARENGSEVAIWGGADHKTGQEPAPRERLAQLEARFRQLVPEAQITNRWSGQVIEPVDGLPYIGPTTETQFIATGFSGNGMTFGTLAGMLATDWILNRRNPWQDLFAPDRKALGSAWNYIRENLDYPYYMVKSRLFEKRSRVADILPGEGRIVMENGKRLAVYRSPGGEFTRLSAVCTHLGCIVKWNNAEQTWDCPCHGSRFQPTGDVLAGPAEKPLARADEER